MKPYVLITFPNFYMLFLGFIFTIFRFFRIMKNAIFLTVSILVLVSCSKDEDAKPTNLELLAGTESKEWYLYATSPESETCPTSSVSIVDNTYTFSSDGTFFYDHGTVTEVPGCDNCCGDLVNITGTWEFTNDETNMKIMALYKTGDPDFVLDIELINGQIDLLESGKLQLSYTNPNTGLEETLEFRVRE
jgi:hypothetical protein